MQALEMLLPSIAHKFVVRAWLGIEVQASSNVKCSHVIIYNQTLRAMHIVRFGSVSKSVHVLSLGLAI